MFDKKVLKIELTLTEPMLGTIAKNTEVYTTFVKAKSLEKFDKESTLPEKEKTEERKRIEQEYAADSEREGASSAEEMLKKGMTGFHRDKKGIFIYDYMIRGYFKSAGEALKWQLPIKNVRTNIDMYVFVYPKVIYLEGKNGKILKEHTGILERSLRVRTMQGPRVGLAKSEMVDTGTTLKFTVEILKNPLGYNPETIKSFLDYGQYSGLGQWRNGSYGRFTYKIA